MFNLFDTDKDGFLKKKEFQDGFCKLFAHAFEENLKLVFDLFDFDSDGKISKEDVRTLLSHVPLAQLLELATTGGPKEGQYTRKCGGTYVFLSRSCASYLFLDRLESQEELVKLLERCMQDKPSLSFEEFSEMTDKISSTVFLCVLYLSFIHIL